MLHSWLPLLQARPGGKRAQVVNAEAATIWGRDRMEGALERPGVGWFWKRGKWKG